MSVYALGLSPPEVEIEYIPVGSSYTVAATISRAPEEYTGDLIITITPRKSGADFFHGDSSFIMPEGTREMTYLYNIIPDYPSETNQELYATFLLQPTSASVGGGVWVITGVTQVVRFTTDIVARPETTDSSSGGTSGGGVSSRSDESTSDNLTDDSDTDSGSQTREVTAPTDPQSQPTTSAPHTQESPTPSQEAQESSSPIAFSNPKTDSKQTPSSSLDFGSVTELPSVERSSLLQTLSLQSSSHPSFDQFYPRDGLMLSWLESGQNSNTTFRFILNYNETASMDELVLETQNPSVFYEGLSDGIYYFHIMDTSNPDAGVTTRRFKIDTTPPFVTPTVVRRPVFSLLPFRQSISLKIVDALAGVAQTQASINGSSVEITDTGISLRGLGFGKHTLSVQAIDNAGNETITEYNITIKHKYPIVETIQQMLSIFFTLFSSLRS